MRPASMLFVPAIVVGLALPALAQNTAPEKPAADQPRQIGYLINQRALSNAKDAAGYAEGWLRAAGMGDTVLGKTRTVGGLYVVDLHAKAGGKALSNQLLLRKQDGYAVLVYPAAKSGDPPAEKAATPDPAREAAIRNAMAGMAGMSGMSGARGIYGGNADPNLAATFKTEDFLIRTPAEAGTAAKLWLFQNGVKNVKVGAIKEQGGIYVGQILAKDSGESRNQFVLRRADGFIAMVNPIKVPASTGGAPAAHGK